MEEKRGYKEVLPTNYKVQERQLSESISLEV
jgi:hypothetical protein